MFDISVISFQGISFGQVLLILEEGMNKKSKKDKKVAAREPKKNHALPKIKERYQEKLKIMTLGLNI